MLKRFIILAWTKRGGAHGWESAARDALTDRVSSWDKVETAILALPDAMRQTPLYKYDFFAEIVDLHSGTVVRKFRAAEIGAKIEELPLELPLTVGY